MTSPNDSKGLHNFSLRHVLAVESLLQGSLVYVFHVFHEGFSLLIITSPIAAAVVQLDRAFALQVEGWVFESQLQQT